MYWLHVSVTETSEPVFWIGDEGKGFYSLSRNKAPSTRMIHNDTQAYS